MHDWHDNGWIWGKRWHLKTRWVRTQESGQTKVEVKMSFGKKQQLLVLRRLSALLFRKENFKIQKMMAEIKLYFGKNCRTYFLELRAQPTFRFKWKYWWGQIFFISFVIWATWHTSLSWQIFSKREHKSNFGEGKEILSFCEVIPISNSFFQKCQKKFSKKASLIECKVDCKCVKSQCPGRLVVQLPWH